MYMVHSMSSVNEGANLPGTEVQPSRLLDSVRSTQRGRGAVGPLSTSRGSIFAS